MNDRLDQELEVQTYRIIQELISNVIKHSRANMLEIQINRFENILSLIIEDNGVGFNVKDITTSNKGIGLKNIASRVNHLKGELIIDSSKEKGTTVSIDIPIDAPIEILKQGENCC